jgi:hypothetical protein
MRVLQSPHWIGVLYSSKIENISELWMQHLWVFIQSTYITDYQSRYSGISKKLKDKIILNEGVQH